MEPSCVCAILTTRLTSDSEIRCESPDLSDSTKKINQSRWSNMCHFDRYLGSWHVIVKHQESWSIEYDFLQGFHLNLISNLGKRGQKPKPRVPPWSFLFQDHFSTESNIWVAPFVRWRSQPLFASFFLPPLVGWTATRDCLHLVES